MLNQKEDDFFNVNEESDKASKDLLSLMSEFNPPKITDISTGSKVQGVITKIGQEYIYIDIGSKHEAIMNKNECLDQNQSLSVKAGETLSGFIISDPVNEIIISKKMAHYHASNTELFDAQKNQIPIQGKITGVSKDGLSVKILGKKAFCPISQIDIKYIDNVNIFLNQTMDFIISKITEGGRNIILSRIPLLEKELNLKLDELCKSIENRTVISGTITKITDFGIFVDIGGIEGLVHISELSWEHVQNPSEKYSVGQNIDVIVLQIQKKTSLKNTKISLSIKQISENPWETVSKKFSVGQLVQGKVVRLTNFGAFIELLPGIDGLVHISEMSWIKKVHHPSEIVTIGTFINATILAIDHIKKTISLSLKDISNDPWRDIESKIPIGSEVKGIIAKKSKYGYFIDISEGVTGLLVFSKISPDKKETLKENDSIAITIESIDTENRRISLSYGLSDNKSEFTQFQDEQNQRQTSTVSNSTEFGAALLAALNRKNQ